MENKHGADCGSPWSDTTDGRGRMNGRISRGNSGMCLHQQIERLLAVFHASAAAACIRPVSKWAAGEARAAPTLEGNWAKSVSSPSLSILEKIELCLPNV